MNDDPDRAYARVDDHTADRTRSEPVEPPRDGGPREAAHFIMSATAELSVLARTHRLDMLGYLLDMAHLEAEDAMRRGQRGPA